MDRHGWHLAHKIGDLIRVVDKTTINTLSGNAEVGDLGVVINCPKETSGILFVEVYLMKSSSIRWFSPSEIDTISNIDE